MPGLSDCHRCCTSRAPWALANRSTVRTAPHTNTPFVWPLSDSSSTLLLACLCEQSKRLDQPKEYGAWGVVVVDVAVHKNLAVIAAGCRSSNRERALWDANQGRRWWRGAGGGEEERGGSATGIRGDLYRCTTTSTSHYGWRWWWGGGELRLQKASGPQSCPPSRSPAPPPASLAADHSTLRKNHSQDRHDSPVEFCA